MSDTKTIYIVESGCYSDRHVVGVFDDVDLATAVATRFAEGAEDITTTTLNPHESDLRAGLTAYIVTMKRDGEAHAGVHTGLTEPLPDDSLATERHQHGWELSVFCWATDEAHAVKIANERRAQWIADGRWDTALDALQLRWNTEWLSRTQAAFRALDERYGGFIKRPYGVAPDWDAIKAQMIADGFVYPWAQEMADVG
jgi:hypothetical protein